MSKSLSNNVVSIKYLGNNSFRISLTVPKDCLNIAYLCMGLAVLKNILECKDGYLSLKCPNEVLCRKSQAFKYVLNYVKFSYDDIKMVLTLTVNKDVLKIEDSKVFQEFITRPRLLLSDIINDLRTSLRFKYVWEFLNNLALLGEEVLITLRDGSRISGEVLGLKLDGSLVLLANNEVRYIDPLKVESVKRLWP